VSFDNKNIIYIHPEYLREVDRKDVNRLKYLLWSIAMLILKFVCNLNFDKLQNIHSNFNEENKEKLLKEIIDDMKVNESVFEFIYILVNYEEKSFTDFYSK
jgi:hypothetical protein